MKLKKIERELLLKGLKKSVKCILTHNGFISDAEMTEVELSLLDDLANKLNETDTSVVIGDFVFCAYITGYDGGEAVAGIKINKALR